MGLLFEDPLVAKRNAKGTAHFEVSPVWRQTRSAEPCHFCLPHSVDLEPALMNETSHTAHIYFQSPFTPPLRGKREETVYCTLISPFKAPQPADIPAEKVLSPSSSLHTLGECLRQSPHKSKKLKHSTPSWQLLGGQAFPLESTMLSRKNNHVFD